MSDGIPPLPPLPPLPNDSTNTPDPILSYRSSTGQTEGAVWRNGAMLICAKGARLPDRCIRCNAYPTTYLRRKLRWHHPGIFVLLLLSPLIYVIVALLANRSATIHIALCGKHRVRRQIFILIATISFLFSIVLF